MAIDEYHAKMDELSEPVYKAVVEETEDGGFLLATFLKKMNNIGLEILFWTTLTLYVLTRLGVFKK